MTPAAQAARAARAAGVSTVPPREDGSKAPLGEWKEFQSRLPTYPELDSWYANGRTGVGVVCGAVSGNLELLEFDDKETFHAYREAAAGVGLSGLFCSIEQSYSEQTPNGHHLFYRLAQGPVAGNTKLARSVGQGGEIKVLIETRGEGGYAVVAPSSGTVHPSTQPYVLLTGGWNTVATITGEERDELHRLARTFDAMPVSVPPATTNVASSLELRPGDDYNVRGSFRHLLEKHGWTWLFRAGDGNEHYRRPGKVLGTSATVKDGQFWCWSSSTGFIAERTYTLFGAYAVLECGGDHGEAAKRLAEVGYGDQRPRLERGNMEFFEKGKSTAVALSQWLSGAA